MSLTLYFFLYPAGHFGLTDVTFFVNFPLIHVIVDFLSFRTTGIAGGVGEEDAIEGVIGSAFAA